MVGTHFARVQVRTPAIKIGIIIEEKSFSNSDRVGDGVASVSTLHNCCGATVLALLA